jgi:DNA invertase Pin-like site-specific DNA recombinase
MDIFGYARVSSLTQDLDLQLAEIKKFADYRGYKIVRIFSDKASGKDMKREGFQEMINAIDKNTMGVEAVVIYKLDRIGRSLNDLIRIVEYMKTKNIQLISITDNIDTTTSQGVLFFQLIGAIAEYERKLINERTDSGRKEAISKGVKFGRPKKQIKVDDIKKELAMGIPKSVICKKYGIKRTTLYNKLKEDKENVKL